MPSDRDRLDSEQQIARHPVLDDGQSAGVRSDVAADPATAFRAEAERQQKSGGRRGVLYVLQDGTGVDRDAHGDGIDFADPVHPLEAHNDLTSGGVRRCAAAVAGVAALRNDSDAVLRREPHDVGDLLRRRGLQHGERRAREELALIRRVGSDPLWIVNDAPAVQKVAKGVNVY